MPLENEDRIRVCGKEENFQLSAPTRDYICERLICEKFVRRENDKRKKVIESGSNFIFP